jgi:HD-GYP domain-containing protein (c-di-GMP phosphodiesterase class II)
VPRKTDDEEAVELTFESFGAQAADGPHAKRVDALLRSVAGGKAPTPEAIEEIVIPVFSALKGIHGHVSDELCWYFPKPAKDCRPLHALNACRLGMHFGVNAGMPDDRTIQLGITGLLYDIGMWLPGTPDTHQARELTREETAKVEASAAAGADLLASMKALDPLCAVVAREHHERADGTGYPARSKAASQHPYSRLFQIIDSYLGMIEPRAFRKPITPVEAMQRLAVQAHRGYFHEAAFRDWLKVIGLFPVGAWVRLNSGDVALVTKSGGDKLRMPTVDIMADELLDFRPSPMEMNLAVETSIEIAGPLKDFPKPGK